MPTSKINRTHGDSGSKPNDGDDFTTGEAADPQSFDWWWTTVTAKINGLVNDINDILDGTVTVGDASNVTSTYKGNDLDPNGDGKVAAADQADNTTNVKGNDIDSDGDGIVDEADYANDGDASSYKGSDIDSDGDGTVDAADTATNVKGNDIDSDGDGVVDAADTASTYKGNDIDSDGDGVVDNADQYDGTSPSDGTGGQVLTTDGTATSWSDGVTVSSFENETGTFRSGENSGTQSVSFTNTYAPSAVVPSVGTEVDSIHNVGNFGARVTGFNTDENGNVVGMDVRYVDADFDGGAIQWWVMGVVA